VALFGGLACAGNEMGVCSVEYEDSLLNFDRVTDARTNAVLPDVTLRDFRYHDRAVSPATVLGGPLRGISAEGEAIRCTAPCGFGSQEGPYSFTVSRSGYRDTTLVVDAKYARRDGGSGGCPLRLSRGVRFTLRLTPA
jgi:hypothetical protein